MEKAKLLGIIGGMSFFLIIVMLVIYVNTDFDQQLIRSVDSGVSTDRLFLQIEDEKDIETIKAQKYLQSKINNLNYWSKTESASKEDFRHYTEAYSVQIQTIMEYENIRLQYVNHQLSKDEFLSKAQIYKKRLEPI